MVTAMGVSRKTEAKQEHVLFSWIGKVARKRRKQIIAAFLFTVFLVGMQAPRVSATNNYVQSNEGHNTIGNTSFTLSFSNSVSSGDILIVMEGTYTSGVTFSTPSDSQGNTWSAAVSTYCGSSDCVGIWYAFAKSTGSDTITLSSPSTSVYTYGFILESSGTYAFDKESTGSGTSSPSVTSFTPYTGALVVAVGAGPSGWGAGTGYTILGSNSGWNAGGQYVPSWGDATTAPFSTSGGSFAEAAASFEPNISTCTSSGGDSSVPGYYYATGYTNQGDRDGVAGYVNAAAWTYASGSNGHSLTYIDLNFDDGTGAHWAQVGLGIGDVGGQTQSSRSIYFEWNTATYNIQWVTSHSIPDNDNGYAKDYAYSANGDGTYNFQLSMSSPYWSSTWSTQPNVGARYKGTLQADTENQYANSYSGSCNTVSINSQTSLVYSSSVTSSPTWSSWTGTCSTYQNSPYVIQSAGCPTSWVENGA